MKYFRSFVRNTIEMTFIAVLFLLSNIANADMADTLQRGEETVVLDVQNMTWVGCVVAVRNSLQKVQGVRKVEVDLDDETATVIFFSEEIDKSLLVAATTNIGFPSVVRKP